MYELQQSNRVMHVDSHVCGMLQARSHDQVTSLQLHINAPFLEAFQCNCKPTNQQPNNQLPTD